MRGLIGWLFPLNFRTQSVQFRPHCELEMRHAWAGLLRSICQWLELLVVSNGMNDCLNNEVNELMLERPQWPQMISIFSIFSVNQTNPRAHLMSLFPHSYFISCHIFRVKIHSRNSSVLYSFCLDHFLYIDLSL